MNKFYLQEGDKHIGPFTLTDLKDKKISQDTLIWYEGLTDWTTANSIDELKPLFVITPPPIKKQDTPKEEVTPPPIITSIPIENTTNKKTNKNKIIYGIVGAVIAIAIITAFVIQNKQHTEELEQTKQQLDNQVNEVKQEVDKQNAEKQKEEADRQNRIKALTAKNMNYRNNWATYITSYTGTYSYREIGGIFNLGVTVSNSTEYILDEVVVAVDYIKASGDNYKTENVTLYNISANSTKRVGAPDSDRGTSVKVRIVSIKARAFKFCYDIYGVGNGNPNDRWQCD